jgi:transcriptional regulator with XRE-family HTH domain
MKLGSNISTMCRDRGWSLSHLAKESGVPVQTLHGWVTGRRSVNPAQLRAVAAAFKVSLYSLLFGEPDPTTPRPRRSRSSSVATFG